MGLAMSALTGTRWLAGKRVRMIGAHSATADALIAAGGTIVAEGVADILVHVAASATVEPMHLLSHDAWRAAMASGLDDRFLAIAAFAAQHREAQTPGSVLLIGAPEQGHGVAQAAAAGALGNLVKTLAVEWARDGIRVNAILTDGGSVATGNLAAYLVSDYAAYVTGAVMGMDIADG
jgi:NAD(P)-dependent dehydrogenase (short-subunit alcohol dehydrogenase family)